MIGSPTVHIGLFQKYHNTLCFPSKILHKHCFQFLWGLTIIMRAVIYSAYICIYLACSFQIQTNHSMIDWWIAEFFINKIFLFEVVKLSCTNDCLLATFCRPRKHKLAMCLSVKEMQCGQVVWALDLQSESPMFKLLPNCYWICSW